MEMQLSNHSEDVSMEDLHMCMQDDLRIFGKKCLEVQQQAENQPCESWGKFISRQGNQKVTMDAAITLYKKNYVNGLCKCLANSLQIAEPSYPKPFKPELKQKMDELLSNDEKLISIMNSELASSQKKIKELERIHQDLLNISAKRAEKGDLTSPDWKTIFEKIRKKRLSLINHLRYVEHKYYGGSNLSSILDDSLKASRKDDPYIPVQDGWEEETELLLRCNFLIRHPHDKTLVRLVDLK